MLAKEFVTYTIKDIWVIKWWAITDFPEIQRHKKKKFKVKLLFAMS